MRIFAPNEVVAKSRFWYFLSKLRKVKKTNGEIVGLNVVCSPLRFRKNLHILTIIRFTRSAHKRSRILVSGSVMIRAPAPTTCTRSTVRCQDARLSMLYTRTWPPVTVLASDQSMYVLWTKECQFALLTNFAGPQGCRDREDRRYQTPIPQAAPHQGSILPSPTSRSKGRHQEDLRCQQAIDFLLSERHIMVLWGGFQSKIGYQWQGLVCSSG